MTTDAAIAVVPANEASWDDLQAVLGTRGDPSRCQCQRYKMRPRKSWASVGAEELAFRLREQTGCGHPESGTTSGLVAYLDGEPVGWCAVEPRSAYPRLLRDCRVPWVGPSGGQDRRQRLGRDLLRHARGLPAPRRQPCARARCRRLRTRARCPRRRGLSDDHRPGKEITWGELHVGSRSIFAAAGFAEVSRPTLRRVVMRIDF